ncbi:MAG: diguanylate cyclase [Amphritea sp.]|nr:diguanylate cyclase [Amphritea sp.]
MKIQHKIVVIPLAVMLLVISTTVLIIELYLESHLLDINKKELNVLAEASLESVRTLEKAEAANDTEILRSFQRLAENFSHAGDFRVTYIDANGKVLGDSDLSFDQLNHLENHADRPEIIQAMESGTGSSERFSSTLNIGMLYVAARSNESHYTDDTSHIAHPLVARISRSQATVQGTIHEMRETLVLTGVLSLAAVLALGMLGARTLNRTVQNEQQLLEKRVQDRTTEISILQTFGGLLNACSTLDEASEVLNNVIPKLLPELKGGISIIKSSRNRLDSIAHWGGDWPGAERFAPGECWALRKGHQHFSTEHGIQTTCNHWLEKPDDNQQTLCIPLLAQGETIGVLHFVMPVDIDMENAQGLWNALAEQIGLTLANIQLRDSLREQAIRDPLTGLFNRRYMLEALDQAHSRAERTKSDIAVMMIDLDHFKMFNDNFGHDAGDHVLKAVAQVLKDSIRQEDIACRFGGEEFCIVCPTTSAEQAQQIAERIRKAISVLELTMNKMALGKVTSSIGIAAYPVHAETMEYTIKAADEALYLAKQNGRDRIELAQVAAIGHFEELEEETRPELEEIL